MCFVTLLALETSTLQCWRPTLKTRIRTSATHNWQPEITWLLLSLFSRPTDPAWLVFWPEQHKIKLVWPYNNWHNYICLNIFSKIYIMIFQALCWPLWNVCAKCRLIMHWRIVCGRMFGKGQWNQSNLQANKVMVREFNLYWHQFVPKNYLFI